MKHFRLVAICISLALLFILLDVFWLGTHGEFPWSGIPGFFAIFGFLGCLVIIAAAKIIGHYWLQRKEDYYNRHDNRE